MRRGRGNGEGAASAERPDPWGVALKLLAMRALSTQELRQRLARRGYAVDQITSVVTKLTAAGYLDDAEYARTWARSRAHRRSLGPARLAGELRAKGIAEPEISATLDEIFRERDVRSVAEAAALGKLRDLRGLAPLVARRRLAAFLARRGFSTGIIVSLCRKHFPQGEDLNDR